jgi:glycosyltransferase involved in cell wall biosynthesis
VRLLIVNFAMDRRSPVLAWQERVADELARQCERVVVLTEQLGEFTPLANLEIHVVPRAFCRVPLRWLRAKWLMNAAVRTWSRRERFDACFIHMNASWAYRLWPVLRSTRVPILLWYAHGTVHWRLRLAHRCADKVVTSTPEGFRIPSAKLEVIGQAIDTSLFRPPRSAPTRDDVVYVGRISRRKRVDLLLDAFAEFVRLAPSSHFRLQIVGPTLTRDDRRYERELKARARRLAIESMVHWRGAVEMPATVDLYRSAFVHLNLSQTGSMDKTVMEALACGCPVATSNPAFRELLSGYPELFLTDDTSKAVARRLLEIQQRPEKFSQNALRGLVEGRHDLRSYVAKVLRACESMGPASA